MGLTHRWARRCKTAFEKTEPLYGHRQFLFGISQGSCFEDLRKASAEHIAELDFDGNAIGGLSVGEPNELMYEMTDLVTDVLPAGKPRYLMGVGTPADLLHGVRNGVDMFDCVMPTRNARNGMLFTWHGKVNLRNARWRNHFAPLDPDFPSDICSRYDMAYIHHLVKCGELLGMQLASVHNLMFYLDLMRVVREKIEDGSFSSWVPGMIQQLDQKL
jgi:queuine tRNA-ribosyltransferase